MENKPLSFHGGKFKIMQVADAQEFPHVSPDTVRLLQMALAAEQPDLVVFTGDQVYGIHPRLWGKTPEKTLRSALCALLAPVIAAGVPFAVTFGNHDAECGVPNARQAGIYAGFAGYTPGERRCAEDPGTFRLPVYGEGGEPKACVYCFDTHGSAAAGGPKGVSPAQIEWFRETRARERAGGNAPAALVFQHIPVPEYYNVIKKVNKGTPGAVEAFGAHRGEFYVLPEELKKDGGLLLEAPAVTGEHTGEFDALAADGAVAAICVGHDHHNSFAAPYKGIKLIYTQGAGFHVYGPHLKRGVRVFALDETDPAAFTTYTRTWQDLTSDRPAGFLLSYALSKVPSSVDLAVAKAKRALPFAGAAGAAAAAVLLKKRKR